MIDRVIMDFLNQLTKEGKLEPGCTIVLQPLKEAIYKAILKELPEKLDWRTDRGYLFNQAIDEVTEALKKLFGGEG